MVSSAANARLIPSDPYKDRQALRRILVSFLHQTTVRRATAESFSLTVSTMQARNGSIPSAAAASKTVRSRLPGSMFRILRATRRAHT